MNYKEFKKEALRTDNIANNNVHFFSRYFSNITAYLLYKMRFSPNGVTWLFLTSGVLCVVSLFKGEALMAYLYWRLHIILDMADGDLARASKVFSKSATGFDRSNHIIINTSLLLISGTSLENILIINFLLVSFFLYYFFGRNYFSVKQSTREYSVYKNFIKDLFSLEGYILSTCLLMYFGISTGQYFLVIFYSICFLSLYLYKLRIFLGNNN